MRSTPRPSLPSPASLLRQTTPRGPRTSAHDVPEFVEVCHLHDIEREGGVVALVAGEAVAVFRTYDDEVYALSNYDPIGRASVLARGIVGTRGGVPYVASPLYKQGFDLRTGACLDNPEGETVRVPTYDVTISADRTVLVGPRQEISELSDAAE